MPNKKSSKRLTKQQFARVRKAKRLSLQIEPPVSLIETTIDVLIKPVEVVESVEMAEAIAPHKPVKKTAVKTIFDLGEVDDELVGTPKEVQKTLDGLALLMQKHPEDDQAFARIHAYIHKYLLGLVFKKYSFVKGHDENDIYQESLIAISKKAIPKFNPKKGMSFLNFAKMCINRHLITILHASNHRRKDMPINQAISLDACPMENDDGHCLLSNVITDDKHSAPPYKEMANRESYMNSLTALKAKLSEFENLVLDLYLQDMSYDEIARNVSRITGVKYDKKSGAKSVDNSLLRIRHKCSELCKEDGESGIPFIM